MKMHNKIFKNSLLKEAKIIGKQYLKNFNICREKNNSKANKDFVCMKMENIIYTERVKAFSGRKPQGLFCRGNKTHII